MSRASSPSPSSMESTFSVSHSMVLSSTSSYPESFGNGSADSLRTPSLAGSDISTEESHASSTLSRHLSEVGEPQYAILDFDDVEVPEIAEVPTELIVAPVTIASLPCLFPFLHDCRFATDDFSTWDTHCAFHFQGKLPPKIQCPFHNCDSSFDDSTSGDAEGAWADRREHIRETHFYSSPCILLPDQVIDVTSRPDGNLCRHLWNNSVVDENEFKQLLRTGTISSSIFMKKAKSQQRREREKGAWRGPHGRKLH